MQIGSITSQKAITLSLMPKQATNNIEKQISSTNPINLNSDPKAFAGRNLVFMGNLKPQITKNSLIDALNNVLNKDAQSEKPVIKTVGENFIENFAQKVTQNPNRNILIGLSGESASGKSEICNAIKEAATNLGVEIETISADNYFKDISALIAKHGSFDAVVESGYDVDSPDNFDLEQLYKDLKALSGGKHVKIPKYLINGSGVSIPNAISKKPEKIILIEGLATLYEPVRSLLDAEIYVNIDATTQETRYIKRALATRNQTKEAALEQLKYVREAAAKYLLPKRNASDIIVDGASEIKRFANLIESLSTNILKNIF